jgi:hypothetical protein
LYGNGKTYLITKLDIVKATGNTNTNVSPSEARKKVDTQVLFLTWEEFEDTKRVIRIEEEQTTQWTKGQTTIYKTYT